MGKNEGLRDFPASQPFAGLLDEGPGHSSPEKRTPIDEKSIQRVLANLKKLTGFTPPTETASHPLEPVQIFHGESPAPAEKPVPKVRQPKKISPAWHSDPEPIMEIAADRQKIRRVLSSDAGHDTSVRRKELRKKMGLPEKAPPWKETLQKFNALTENDKDILRKMGYKPERVRNPYSETVECMLRDLQQSRNS
jgi:hypothetical protein